MSDNHMKSAEDIAKAATETYKKAEESMTELFEGVDMAVPEAVRAMAEKSVAQSREAYEAAKGSMEEAAEVLEKSIDQAGQGAAAINRKVIDNAQANLNKGFDFAKEMAGAKNVAEIMELQSAFVRKQFELLTAQAEEIRELSAKVATDTATPIKDHVSKSIDKATSK